MMTPTVCLNLSNNGLVEVENNSLTRLVQLTTLDLSYNNLTHLPTLNTINGRDFWLDISGEHYCEQHAVFLEKSMKTTLYFIGTNTLWCHDIHQYINKTGDKPINFSREKDTVCSASKTWHWFNSTEQVPLQQVRYLSMVSRFVLRLFSIYLFIVSASQYSCPCTVAKVMPQRGNVALRLHLSSIRL